MEKKEVRTVKPLSMRIYGLIGAILSLVILTCAGGMLIIKDLVLNTGAKINLWEFIKSLFNDGNATKIIVAVIYFMALIAVFVYSIIGIVSMFRKTCRITKDPNLLVYFGLAVIWYMACIALKSTTRVISNRVYWFAIAYAVELIIIASYYFVLTIMMRKRTEPVGKRLIKICVFGAIMSGLVLGLSCGYFMINRHMHNIITLVEDFTAERPIMSGNLIYAFAHYVANVIPTIGCITDAVNFFLNTCVLITSVWLVVEFARLIPVVAMTIAKFFFDANYIRKCNYFKKTSPVDAAVKLAFIPVFADICVILVKLINNGNNIGNYFVDDISSWILCLVVCVLALIYKGFVKNDKYQYLADQKNEEAFYKFNNQIPENTQESEEKVESEKKDEPQQAQPQQAQPQVQSQPAQFIVSADGTVKAQTAPFIIYAMPQQAQPQVQPIVIQLPPQFMGQPCMIQQPAQPVAPVAPVQPAQPVAPVQPAQPVAPAQSAEPNEEAIDDDEKNVTFNMAKQTLEEKIAELSANDKKLYNSVVNYASLLVGVKRVKSTYADTISFGRDLITKVNIKQGKVVCLFMIVDYDFKKLLESGNKVKPQKMQVKVLDQASLDYAKKTIDLAYQKAVANKEAKHQEQLEKRRAERNAKKNG